MQNRYTGDMGDFSKLGLLRALQSASFSIGLNWYLAPDETHNSDGRHVGYLSQDECRACDPGLWDELGAIVKRGNREVRSMEHDAVLQATFFSDCLDFRGLRKAERVELRRAWFANSLVAMAGKDIVCVDPDNGLVVPSALGRPTRRNTPQVITLSRAETGTTRWLARWSCTRASGCRLTGFRRSTRTSCRRVCRSYRLTTLRKSRAAAARTCRTCLG